MEEETHSVFHDDMGGIKETTGIFVTFPAHLNNWTVGLDMGDLCFPPLCGKKGEVHFK